MSTRSRRRATETPTVTPTWVMPLDPVSRWGRNAANTWWERLSHVRVSDAAALDLLCGRSVSIGRGHPNRPPDVDGPKLSHPKPGSLGDCLRATWTNASTGSDAMDRVEGVIAAWVHPDESLIFVDIIRLDGGHLVKWSLEDGDGKTIERALTHATTRREAAEVAMMLASRTSGMGGYTYPMTVVTGEEFRENSATGGRSVTSPLTRALGPERSRSAF